MKKKLLFVILGAILLTLFVSVLIINNQNKSKFYLSDNYYKNEGLININNKELQTVINNKDSFLLFVYNNYCSFSAPCDSIFESVISKNEITMLQMKFEDFKENELHKEILYSPTVIIFKDGKVVKYLNAENDKDLDIYQNTSKFENWLSKNIFLKK